MAYDEQLAQRIRSALSGDAAVTEKKMFGGIAFLQRDLMFAGIVGQTLMVRVGKDLYADSLKRMHVREMDFTGQPMQGYVFVDAPGLARGEQLRFWLQRGQGFVATMPPKKPKPARARR
jgi:hypothetical protein